MTNNEWTEREISIAEIETLLSKGYEIEVTSPDGWVPVDGFVHKGLWEEYVLMIDGMNPIRCNENHLFETTIGWHSALELLGKECYILTTNGYKLGVIERTYKKIPIVDITVDHPNHRYYTDGVSSHNTGVGKSLFMCHMASSCLNQGKNVLYITLELAEEEVARRIDANLMNITFEDLSALSKDMYDKRVGNIKKKTNGKLIIKEYPTASASVTHFRGLINELRLKKNFTPDMVFIDYLNICTSSRIKPGSNVNSYSYIKSIAEELRGFAVELQVPVVSATQTNRTGFVSSDVGLEDTSESFGLPATADFMFALIATEELTELNQIMVKQLKNRYNDPNVCKRFMIGVDRSKMKLYDLEESAQKDLVDAGTSAPEKESRQSKFRGIKV